MITKLDSSNFAENISKGLKLVEFYAPWCGYCKKQQEILQTMNDIWIGQFNGDEAPDLARTYNISGYPTFIYFKDGVEIGRFSGYHEKFDMMNILLKLTGENLKKSDKESKKEILDEEADEDF